MTLLFEFLIVVVFWSLLFKDIKDLDYGWLWDFLQRGEHSIPFGLLVVDFCLNHCVYELKLLWTELIVLTIYGLINLVVTKISGHPVYPPLSWDSVGSVFLALGMVPLAAIFAVILYYLSKLKHKVFGGHSARVELRKDLL